MSKAGQRAGRGSPLVGYVTPVAVIGAERGPAYPEAVEAGWFQPARRA